MVRQQLENRRIVQFGWCTNILVRTALIVIGTHSSEKSPIMENLNATNVGDRVVPGFGDSIETRIGFSESVKLSEDWHVFDVRFWNGWSRIIHDSSTRVIALEVNQTAAGTWSLNGCVCDLDRVDKYLLGDGGSLATGNGYAFLPDGPCKIENDWYVPLCHVDNDGLKFVYSVIVLKNRSSEIVSHELFAGPFTLHSPKEGSVFLAKTGVNRLLFLTGCKDRNFQFEKGDWSTVPDDPSNKGLFWTDSGSLWRTIHLDSNRIRVEPVDDSIMTTHEFTVPDGITLARVREVSEEVVVWLGHNIKGDTKWHGSFVNDKTIALGDDIVDVSSSKNGKLLLLKHELRGWLSVHEFTNGKSRKVQETAIDEKVDYILLDASMSAIDDVIVLGWRTWRIPK